MAGTGAVAALLCRVPATGQRSPEVEVPRLRRRRLLAPAELGAVRPDAMQDDGELPGDRDHRPFVAELVRRMARWTRIVSRYPSLSTSGDRSPRLQAKRRLKEVASCDDPAGTVTRCAFNARPVWAPKRRFAVVSGTITSEKVRRSRTTVDFKSTPLEPLALQARVVQFLLSARF